MRGCDPMIVDRETELNLIGRLSMQASEMSLYPPDANNERGGDKMNQSFGAIVRKPSAYLPLAMSLTALSLLAGAYIYALATGRAGHEHQQDEGSIAHLWQLLMAGQLPVLIFFAIKWLPRAPRQTLYVLALQASAALAAMAPVYFLNL
jgi:hypothetical protein